MKKTLVLVLTLSLLLAAAMTSYADTYTVKEGDVLWRIAKENDTTVEALTELNDLNDSNLIYAGQTLELAETVESEESKMTNAQKAVALIESLGTDNHEPVGYINPAKYIQHNLGVADGLEGFGALAAQLPEGTYGKNIRVIEDGLIVEHWDVIETIPAQENWMNDNGKF